MGIYPVLNVIGLQCFGKHAVGLSELIDEALDAYAIPLVGGERLDKGKNLRDIGRGSGSDCDRHASIVECDAGHKLGPAGHSTVRGNQQGTEEPGYSNQAISGVSDLACVPYFERKSLIRKIGEGVVTMYGLVLHGRFDLT